MPNFRSIALASLVFTSFVLGCTKSEPSPAPAASVTVASAAVPSAGAAAAPAGTDAGKVAAKEAPREGAKDAAASPQATASAAGGNGANECGTKPLPDCPLQAWMKENANTPITTNDTAALGGVFDKIATFAPLAAYDNWEPISKDGAKAARAGEMSAAKAACRSCHDQYKRKYRTEMRARKL